MVCKCASYKSGCARKATARHDCKIANCRASEIRAFSQSKEFAKAASPTVVPLVVSSDRPPPPPLHTQSTTIFFCRWRSGSIGDRWIDRLATHSSYAGLTSIEDFIRLNERDDDFIRSGLWVAALLAGRPKDQNRTGSATSEPAGSSTAQVRWEIILNDLQSLLAI
jgi:hypothetical protein